MITIKADENVDAQVMPFAHFGQSGSCPTAAAAALFMCNVMSVNWLCNTLSTISTGKSQRLVN